MSQSGVVTVSLTVPFVRAEVEVFLPPQQPRWFVQTPKNVVQSELTLLSHDRRVENQPNDELKEQFTLK